MELRWTRPRLIRGGLVFDGLGGEGVRKDVWLEDGKVGELLEPGAPVPSTARPDEIEEIDATGAWVMPGFVDLHTHYDAEVEILPGLEESVRHGVTTIVMGSCGLSMAAGEPEDMADMFCRVEGIPRATVLPLLQEIATWDGPAEYFEHLDSLPLGPNVAALLGHSTIRAEAMGLERACKAGEQPTEAELQKMESRLAEALDAGYLGLSINTLPWDKMDGDRVRSQPTPSVFANWSEYRRLAKPLRRRGRIFQGVPDVSRKVNAIWFFLATAGWARRPLRTMLITLLDAKAARGSFRVIGTAARLTNSVLRGDIRFQSLPNTFDLWVDGMEVPVLEEIGAGTEALHIEDREERARLLRDPDFRRRFRKQWASKWLGRAYHRDLDEAKIVGCPDAALVGRSFADVARERGGDSVDTFLDLLAEYGDDLRWYTVVGNDRERWLQWIVKHPSVLIGFSDAGAHLRNMAYYNYPLRLLKLVRDAEGRGEAFMSTGEAVRRLTSEIADWLGLDTGRLEPGARADLVIVDPAGLDESVEDLHEAPLEGFADLRRLVRRNDAAVRQVVIGGEPVYGEGRFVEGFGKARSYGEVLRVGDR